MPESKIDGPTRLYFEFFNEVGIIEQLSRTLFEAKLPSGFLISHFSVLNHLARLGDGQTPLSMANAFQIPKTTLAHTLMGLEKHMLIEMRPNPKDGRSKLVFLTQKGDNFRLKAIGSLQEEFTQFAKVFKLGDITNMTQELSKVRQYLDELRNETNG